MGNVEDIYKRTPRDATFNVLHHSAVAPGLHLVDANGDIGGLQMPDYELDSTLPPPLFLTLPEEPTVGKIVSTYTSKMTNLLKGSAPVSIANAPSSLPIYCGASTRSCTFNYATHATKAHCLRAPPLNNIFRRPQKSTDMKPTKRRQTNLSRTFHGSSIWTNNPRQISVGLFPVLQR